jgi:DNA-cytosine methyltransferase
MESEKVVVSLFDGMSCGQISINNLGIKISKYFASEIDKNAIKITQKNYPDTIQIGDVTKVSYKDGILYTENGDYEVGHVDLLIGGSPCTGFSKAGRNLNFEDPQSKLFFEYVRIMNEMKPTNFLLENVVMKQEFQDIITRFCLKDAIFFRTK